MTRWGRVARGTIAAGTSVFFAAFAHSLAGGSLPGVAGLALCLIFSIIVCIAFTGRRMPRTRLAASILASQAMYHWLFGSLGTLDAIASPTTGSLGHVHNAPITFSPVGPHIHDHGDMLWAHVAAAAVTFTVLAFGERIITAAILAARTFVLSLLPIFTAAPLASARSRLLAHGTHHTAPLQHRADHSGLRHRGPPMAVVA